MLNGYRHLANRWRNWCALQGHTITENYNAGRLSIVCDLDVSVPLDVIRSDVRGYDQPIRNDKYCAVLSLNSDMRYESHLSFGYQEPMLVDIVEIVQVPENISIPSRIRLYHIDDEFPQLLRCFGSTFQSVIDGSYKFIFGFANREILGFRAEAMHNVIERTAKVMESIAKSENEVFWDGCSILQAQAIARSLRVIIDVNNVRVSIVESLNERIKISDVLVGPFDS